MGEVYIGIAIENLRTGARADQITALVDTSSTLSVIPRTLLESLGIDPTDSAIGILADGREVTRDVGVALVTVNDAATACNVLFGEAEDTVIVGVTVLQQLGLAVDPVRHRVVPGRILF
jgi:aspartyl protease family protein